MQQNTKYNTSSLKTGTKEENLQYICKQLKTMTCTSLIDLKRLIYYCQKHMENICGKTCLSNINVTEMFRTVLSYFT